MGIKDANMTEWKVIKVKDHSDCIDGEHWKAFGISYRKFNSDLIEELNKEK